jgi:hypothetical protein
MPELSHNALTTLLNLIDYGEAVKERTNQELHDILVEQIWAELDIDTAAAAFIGEIADRLLKIDALVALNEELERMVSLETRQAVEIGDLKSRCLEPVPASLEFDLITYAIKTGDLPKGYHVGRQPAAEGEVVQ